MSQAQSNIRSALMAAYDAANTGLDTAYPNRPFDQPSADMPWAQLFVLTSSSEPETLGDKGEDYHSGILQVNLNFPVGKGEGAVLQLVDELFTHFQAGQRSIHNGQEVIFRGASRNGGRVVNGWWQVIVSVSWYALAPRS